VFAQSVLPPVTNGFVRVIIDLADRHDVHDVVAEALLVRGASREKLTAAMLGGSS
jgi:hypothetical protein